MNAAVEPRAHAAHAVADAVARACDRIAPSWPLDRFIAVNPHWGWTDQPIEDAAAALGVLAGMKLLPDLDVARRPLLADLAGLRDTVVHQISQHCGACFDDGQARWHLPADEGPPGAAGPDAAGAAHGGLYRSWLRRVAADAGLHWPQGRPAALALLAELPRAPLDAIAFVLERLDVAPEGTDATLTAWLLDLNGWAAACAWRRWQARLAGGDDPWVVELLAVRAAWDALIAPSLPAAVVAGWSHARGRLDAAVAAERARQRSGWQQMLEREHALQDTVMAALQGVASAAPASASATAGAGATATAGATASEPATQAVFCIDVRSEVFRRALEHADPAIATRGFAGFFGLPVDHRPAGTHWRQPQLPGLLAPALTVDDAPVAAPAGAAASDGAPLAQALVRRRRARLAAAAGWDDWRGVPAAAFSMAEACGLSYALDLLRASLPGGGPRAATPTPWQHAGLSAAEARGLRPRLALPAAAAAADRVHGVLRAMGLTGGFAPVLLLCGHGGQSANNPHAAGLDCGACGGQTGEVNARALAALLNDPAVRAALRPRGIDLPATTHVLAGLHNTTTDEVTLYEIEAAPATHRGAIARLQAALARAGDAARAERAPGLKLPPLPAPRLLARLRERARHWAELRPEWALVDNAAFIAAPRARTRGAHLGGRVFLHDYDHAGDTDLAVLTLILSAPMVVAHWINLQYLASSVDPQRHGAGNKLLHNVVGAGVGVFEGNGGDLRIGLPWQSVHDGERLRHTPRRLSVFVEAPPAALDAVLAVQPTVRRLVDHGWVHLVAMAREKGLEAGLRFLRRRRGGGWDAVPAPFAQATPTGRSAMP